MTREHVFARWLVQKVHGARLVASMPGATSSEAPVRVARVIADVCAECNAGWMSSLEVGLRRIVFARPRAGIIPAPDRVTLSRWFTKTAVLLANAAGGALVGATHTPRLIAGMPDDVEVFVARRRRPPQRLDFAIEADNDDINDVLRVRTVAMQVDDVIGHVGARGSLGSKHGTQLWPLRSHTLRWETLPVITVARSEQSSR
jgi:hypothetical protein